MGPLRRRGFRAWDLVVVAAIVGALLALALSRASGSVAPERDRFASHHFGFSGSLPSGWSRSTARLVPLLMPREVLSAGTAAMPAGGGGNCGREPVAAVARMRPGDALVSIQEYAVTPRMRGRLARTFPTLTAYSEPARLQLRRHSRAAIPGHRDGPPLWSATLPFRDRGRAFDALVYLAGQPSPQRLRQVASLLAGLEFRPA